MPKRCEIDSLSGIDTVEPIESEPQLTLRVSGRALGWRLTAVRQHISGCGATEDGAPVAMGKPTDWQSPRRYELGFRLEF